jgi:hypothetical protein
MTTYGSMHANNINTHSMQQQGTHPGPQHIKMCLVATLVSTTPTAFTPQLHNHMFFERI